MKAALLKRKFLSIEYMEEMRRNHKAATERLRDSIKWFYDNQPESVNWREWNRGDQPAAWEERVLPNFISKQKSFVAAIEKARAGDTLHISAACGDFTGIYRDLDNFGWKWFEYIPNELELEFRDKITLTKRMAKMIWKTNRNSWKLSSILDEEITGPIDGQELLKYLQPGESA